MTLIARFYRVRILADLSYLVRLLRQVSQGFFGFVLGVHGKVLDPNCYLRLSSIFRFVTESEVRSNVEIFEAV